MTSRAASAPPPAPTFADPRLSDLVARLQPSLLRVARGLCPSAAVAEEVVQETWVAVLEGIAAFRGESSLKTWIFGILIKRAHTRAKVEGRSVPFSAQEPADSSGEGPFDERGSWLTSQLPQRWPSPEDSAAARESVRLLEAELEKLPSAQRAVVLLRDVEGLSSDEACNVLGVSETNQRVLLHRGRCALRAALSEHWKTPGGSSDPGAER